MSLLKRYESALVAAPLRTKILTSFVFGVGSNLVAQLMSEEKRLRLKQLLVFGFASSIPFGHFWFGFLNRLQFPANYPSALVTVLKVVLDQLLYAPLVICAFIINVNVLDHPHSLSAALQIIRQDLLTKILPSNWKVWPLAVFICQTLVPLHYRTVFMDIVGFFWGIAMTFLSKQKKGKPKTKEASCIEDPPRRLSSVPVATASAAAQAEALFEMADEDGNGTLEKNELKKFLKTHEETFNQLMEKTGLAKEAKKKRKSSSEFEMNMKIGMNFDIIWHKLDEDNDKTVSKGEWLRVFKAASAAKVVAETSKGYETAKSTLLKEAQKVEASDKVIEGLERQLILSSEAAKKAALTVERDAARAVEDAQDEAQAAAEALFEAADVDRSGTLDRQELKVFLKSHEDALNRLLTKLNFVKKSKRRVGKALTEFEKNIAVGMNVNCIWNLLDENCDGKISKEEWLASMM